MPRIAPLLPLLLAAASLASGSGAAALLAPLVLDGARSGLGAGLRVLVAAAAVGTLTAAACLASVLAAALLALRPWEAPPAPRRHAPMEIPE